MVQRRSLLALAATALAGAPVARAHHGWSSFDPDRPVYLEGVVRAVRWRNPHAELDLELAGDLRLPPDLAGRNVPAQSAPVDARALLARTALPTRRDRRWEIELAPLTRLEAWKLAPIAVGTPLAMVGFTFPKEQGAAVLRVEYLFVGEATYALRSSPA